MALLRGWIPALPLMLGLAAFGLSWVLLGELAWAGLLAPSLPAFGYVHLVVLGWITLVALSVLLHVIPAFLDVRWRAEPLVRSTLPAYALGVALLVCGFLLTRLALIEAGGLLAALALAIYVVLAVATLGQAMRGEDRTERAVARAFALTLLFLLATAALGALFVLALAGRTSASALIALPPAHAVLGLAGWLTLLIVGVSARTLGPMCGDRSRWRRLHILSGSLLMLGSIVLAAGLGARLPEARLAGSVVLDLGVLVYAVDVVDIVARATVPHRPPQWMMLFAVFGALATAALVTLCVCGWNLGSAAVYAASIAWIGNALLAHLHHIGVRVLLTLVRGEDDETRPGSVLALPLTWLTFGAYQAAAILGIGGLAMGRGSFVEAAAACGLLAFVAMIVNLTIARRNAARLGVTASD